MGGSPYLWLFVSKSEQEEEREVKEVNSPKSCRPCSHPWTMMRCQSHRPTTKIDEDVPTDPEGCDFEAKSVEGVEAKDSVRSSIHPPASLLKRSNQKGRGS